MPQPLATLRAKVAPGVMTFQGPSAVSLRSALRPSLEARPMVEAGRTRAGRSLGRSAPELVASMRPRCPWREAEAAELRPKAPGRLDSEDVGFVSPGHCPGREQEEAAAHPGRPHPGEWPRSAARPMTLVHLRSAGGDHGGSARHGRAAGPGPAPQPPPIPHLGMDDQQIREGLLRGSWRPEDYVSRQAARRLVLGRGRCTCATPGGPRGPAWGPAPPLRVFLAAVPELGGC